MIRARHAIVAIALVAASLPLRAERADRDKPTLIDSGKCVTNELKQVSVCTGDVVLTRGTLRITGDRMEVREDPEGYRQAIVTGGGSLATFRQRQDTTRPGVEEYVEGQAERIEYDERAETVKLIQRAQWKRLENNQPRDEVAGNLITYDSRSSTYSVAGGRDGAGGDGRVRLILSPRKDGEAPADKPAPPAELKPSTTLSPPAKK